MAISLVASYGNPTLLTFAGTATEFLDSKNDSSIVGSDGLRLCCEKFREDSSWRGEMVIIVQSSAPYAATLSVTRMVSLEGITSSNDDHSGQ